MKVNKRVAVPRFPNLGSPLANMVDEIYSDPLIANARPSGAIGIVYSTMMAFIQDLPNQGGPPAILGLCHKWPSS